jgi:Ca2+/H+ antiporter, TMEM165/GDT1 family
MVDWTHAGGTVLAAFLASLVEFVEALTIVLAVGTVRGWRPALLGTGAGMVLLLLLIAGLGPLIAAVPITWLQLSVGVLLLLFGLRWLKKAILRAGGIIPLHDEDAAYAEETRSLRASGRSRGLWDTIAVTTAFKAVVLEGMEVVFIVVAMGATAGLLLPAAAGAGVALLGVILLGLALHRPLARVPENTLKLVVGVMLAAFGVFWVAEGAGLPWPGGDLALPALALGFLGVALAMAALLRRSATPTLRKRRA